MSFNLHSIVHFENYKICVFLQGFILVRPNPNPTPLLLYIFSVCLESWMIGILVSLIIFGASVLATVFCVSYHLCASCFELLYYTILHNWRSTRYNWQSVNLFQ
jgi:hypothetical protein